MASNIIRDGQTLAKMIGGKEVSPRAHAAFRRLLREQGRLLGVFKRKTLETALAKLMNVGLSLGLTNERKLFIAYEPKTNRHVIEQKRSKTWSANMPKRRDL